MHCVSDLGRVPPGAAHLAFQDRSACHGELLALLAQPERGALVDGAGRAIAASLQSGGAVFFCGNGGSSAEALHLVAEFVGRFRKERRPLAAIALGTNPAVSSALANDYGFAEGGLARELEALARSGDVLVALSTSGRSPNIVNAVAAARERGVTSVLLCGRLRDGVPDADYVISVDSTIVAHIQEIHAVIGHVLCEIVEQELGVS